MTIRPLSDRVLLELIPDAQVSSGGIHLPDNLAKPAPGFSKRARVIGVGPRVKAKQLKPGRIVRAVWNCGVPVPMAVLPEGAEEQRLIKEEDVVSYE